MSRALLVLFAIPAIALAAPVPKETEADKIKRLFGATVDPEKNSKFSLDGEKLVLRVTDAPHLMQLGDLSAPRVTRTVEGDFTASVRISLPLPRRDEPLPARRGQLVQVGFFLSDDGNVLATHARTLTPTPGQKDPFRRQGQFYVWQPNSSSSFGSGGGAFDPETVHFRLRRDSGKLFAAASADGKSWHEFGGNQTPFPEKATLGLYLANPSGLPYAVAFEGFTVTPKSKQ